MLEFRHIHADRFAAKEIFGQAVNAFCFADSGWPQEKKAPAWAVSMGKSPFSPLHRTDNG